MTPGRPAGLEAAIVRCLERGPARRRQKVDQLAQAPNTVSSGAEAA